jgi:hypothetical protein
MQRQDRFEFATDLPKRQPDCADKLVTRGVNGSKSLFLPLHFRLARHEPACRRA